MQSDPLRRLELLVVHVASLPQQRYFERRGTKPRDHMEPIEYVDYCAQALLMGALPNAETLLTIAIAMNRYVDAEGRLTLDEAFGLVSRHKIGNPSKQRAMRNKRLSLLFDIAMLLAANPDLSMEEAASQVAVDDPTGNLAETLMRDYRRQGFQKFESSLRAMIPNS